MSDPLRGRGEVIFIAIVVTVVTFIACAVSAGLVQLGCVANADTAACIETEGGRVGPIEALLVLGPTILVALAGAAAVRRRELRPVVLAAVVLAPLGFLLPPLVWG